MNEVIREKNGAGNYAWLFDKQYEILSKSHKVFGKYLDTFAMDDWGEKGPVLVV